MLVLQQQQKCTARNHGSRAMVHARLDICRPVISTKSRTFTQANVTSVAPILIQHLHQRCDRAICYATPQGVASTSSLPALPSLDSSYEDKCTFSSYANWIIPGKVLLGRYPYIEPSRCSKREQGDKQLQEILNTGVDTFIQLQAELPPQKELHLSGKDGFMPYNATADLIRAAMEPPPPMEIVQGLRNPTLDKFLPPKKKGASSWHPKELQYVHSPIVDLGVPTEEQLTQIIKDIEARVAKGEVLYVHCWGGRGRAGTVGACLLASAYGVSAEEALERVQRSYNTRKDPERSKSPETDEQFKFVRSYIEKNRR